VAAQKLFIRLETAEQRDALGKFLLTRRIDTSAEGELSLGYDWAGEGATSLASVVAAVEEWRRGSCVVVLEVGERKTTLRTEA
jgi:hypothetical protein